MYYCGDELMARHYNINMICGSRLGGKSTWVQKYIIKRAMKAKMIKGIAQNQFALLVRYDKDLTGPTALPVTYFDNTMMMFYPQFEIKYEAGKFYLQLKGNDKVRTLIGYAFALSNATKMKSTSYPLINTMVMEEFMNMEGKYIKSQQNPELEVELLISLFSTVARGNGKQFRDNVRCFLISNNFYLDNPYFKYFDFISQIVQNPTKRFYYKNTDQIKCIVEMIRNDINLGIGRDDTYKGSKFIDMQNELRYMSSNNVKKVLFQISLDNREFLNFARYNDSYAVFSNGNIVRPDCMVWSCSKIKRQGISDMKELKKMLNWKVMVQEYNDNTLYYDRLETYILFKNILENV